jgi:hypothetical protein
MLFAVKVGPLVGAAVVVAGAVGVAEGVAAVLDALGVLLVPDVLVVLLLPQPG